MRPGIGVLAALFLALACSRAHPPAAGAGPLGLWVLAEGSERTLESPQKIAGLVAQAEKMGVTDLFVQVHRAGKSWFASTHADDAPFRAIRSANPDAPEPLADVIARAHAKGIRVHAWFNCLALAANRDAPIVRKIGRDAIQVDRVGRSLLDYPDGNVPQPDAKWLELETPGYWLDPAVPAVVDALAETVDDLVKAAPDLDGLHLDYIRYPYTLPMTPGSRFRGLDFGYGDVAKARFVAESGSNFEPGDKWDEFRRARVTELVTRLRAHMPKKWKLSAAVLAYADRAYLTSMQDWRGWLDGGPLDFAVAMAYTRDDKMLRYLAHGLHGGVGGDKVWLGLGTWLVVDDTARIAKQVSLAREVSPPGISLFSWDALAAKPAALEALSRK
jgi:uncharacterized lipoprotein YddW (UPF0748 family)